MPHLADGPLADAVCQTWHLLDAASHMRRLPDGHLADGRWRLPDTHLADTHLPDTHLGPSTRRRLPDGPLPDSVC